MEREDTGLSIVPTAAVIFAFVVTHKEEIKTAIELAPVAAKIVAGLIGLAQRRKIKMKLVEGGRQITIEAANCSDLEQAIVAVLRVQPTAPAG